MIEILVSEFYNRPELYPYMPARIFDALEQAFINGERTARVPVADYDRMMAEYSQKSNDENNDTDQQHAIRPTAVF